MINTIEQASKLIYNLSYSEKLALKDSIDRGYDVLNTYVPEHYREIFINDLRRLLGDE
jgi:hypothetical protein